MDGFGTVWPCGFLASFTFVLPLVLCSKTFLITGGALLASRHKVSILLGCILSCDAETDIIQQWLTVCTRADRSHTGHT